MRIEYKNIILRDMVTSDIEDDIRWKTIDTEWTLWDEPWNEDGFDEPIDIEELRLSGQKEFEKIMILSQENSFRWCLEIDYEDGTHIGTVDSYLIDESFNKVTDQEIQDENMFYAIGIAIFEPSYWNRGLGTQALLAYVEHHLEHQHNPLYIQTWSGNHRMVRSAEKIGFYVCDRKTNLREVRGAMYDGLTLRLDGEEFKRRNKKETI